MSNNKNIYFLSDFHLGAPNKEVSLIREKRIVAFLESIQNVASEIFIVGDMFDFWYEYKNVVPKGYVRLLGKLAQLTDAGIPIHFFVGNHDMWMRNYFETELNIPVYYEPQIIERNGLKIFIGHGDGLGPGDKGYKRLKKLFRNPVSKFLFGIMPPQLGIGIANFFSKKSRIATGTTDGVYLGDEKEWLVQYCKHKLSEQHFDLFIFGHRHLPINMQVGINSTYINLGEWINYESYAVIAGTTIALQYNK